MLLWSARLYASRVPELPLCILEFFKLWPHAGAPIWLTNTAAARVALRFDLTLNRLEQSRARKIRRRAAAAQTEVFPTTLTCLHSSAQLTLRVQDEANQSVSWCSRIRVGRSWGRCSKGQHVASMQIQCLADRGCPVHSTLFSVPAVAPLLLHSSPKHTSVIECCLWRGPQAPSRSATCGLTKTKGSIVPSSSTICSDVGRINIRKMKLASARSASR